MNYLLHIDTSTDAGVVAIGRDGLLIASRINVESRNHAATLNLMIDDVLSEAKIELENIAGVVVCGGPGSYTGLRIGLSTAKGLCYALGKPLLLHNRLTLLAHQGISHFRQHYDHFAALVRARDREYFFTLYSSKFECLQAPQHITEDQFVDVVGNFENTYMLTDASDFINYCPGVNNLVTSTNINIDLITWITYGYKQFLQGEFENLSLAEPFYLKQVYTHK